MAITGDTGTTKYIKSGTVTAPSTYSFIVHYQNPSAPGNVAIDQILGIGATTTPVVNFTWDHTGGASLHQGVQHRTSGGSFINAKLTTALTGNTWYRIGGRYDGTNLTAWLNGVQEASTAAAAPSTPASCSVWGLCSSGVPAANYDNGTIAFLCFWNVALTDGEMKALGVGFHPTLIRPQSILEGSDCTRSVIPYRNAGWTVNGSPTVSTNPPIIMRSAPIIIRPSVVVGGDFKAAWARNTNVIIGAGARAA